MEEEGTMLARKAFGLQAANYVEGRKRGSGGTMPSLGKWRREAKASFIISHARQRSTGGRDGTKLRKGTRANVVNSTLKNMSMKEVHKGGQQMALLSMRLA